MNLDSKCDCTHCGEPISFPADAVGQTVECPHCLHQTVLKSREIPPEPAIQENILTGPGPEKKESIETTLDGIGQIFFIIGLIGGGICGMAIFFILASNTGDLDTGDKMIIAQAIAGGIVFIGQGIIVKTLFRAAGEGIRLLRKISDNKTT